MENGYSRKRLKNAKIAAKTIIIISKKAKNAKIQQNMYNVVGGINHDFRF